MRDLVTEAIDSYFQPQLCPATAKLMLGRRFALPNYRCADYFNQERINKGTLANLLLPTFPEGEACLDDVMRGCIANTVLAVNCGRPVLFLERELGEVLLGGKLPPDLATEDIRPPWPGFRIMLPRGLLSIEREGWTGSLMFLDFGFLRAGQDHALPRVISAELDVLSLAHFGASATNLKLSQMCFTYPEDCVSLNGIVDNQGSEKTPTAYGLTKPWPKGPLAKVTAFKGALKTLWPTDADDDSFLFRMENLALNLLILLSQVPFEYEPEAVERREKREGKRVIPALLRPRWVGDYLVRARSAGQVKGDVPAQKTVHGRHVGAHWTRAHWKRQAHGPALSLRKLVWILPYHSGKLAVA